MKKYILLVWECAYPILIHFGISLFLGVAYIFVGTFLEVFKQQGNMDIQAVTNQVMENYMNHSLYIMAVSSCITIPLLYLFFRLDKKKLPSLPKVENKPMEWIVLVVVAATVCISLNSLITYSGISEIFDGFNEVAEYLYAGGIVVEILVVGILVPVSEELLFRGLIFQRLALYTKPATAIVVSALIFGIYHGNVVQGIYAFCIGAIMAMCYWKFQNLLAPICMHMVANIVSVCITEIEVVGNIFENQVVGIVATIITTVLWILGLIFLMKKQGIHSENGQLQAG